MEMMIHLEQMKFYAYHGVLEQEKLVGNTFIVDLSVGIDAYQSLIEDKLENTINYVLVYEKVKSEVEVPSELLETLVGRIVKVLFAEFALITSVAIKLTKLNPPFTADIQGASVSLRMSREEYYSVFSVSLP